jgi:hypothetical protein
MKSYYFLIAVTVASCVDRGPGPSGKKIESSYIRENLLDRYPSDLTYRIDVDLGNGKLLYYGNTISYADGRDWQTPLAPGGTIRFKHIWHVNYPFGGNWRVFSFVRGEPGSADFMALGPTDMEIGYPPNKWKPGQTIQDVQDIVLRPDWRSPTATVYIGLVEIGKHQIGDRMSAHTTMGPYVVDRAIVARTIKVDLSKAPPPPGTVYVPHAAGPITIDGIANEPGWSTAATSSELVTGDGSPDPVGRAIARMTWDEQNLYVYVSVTDTDVFSQFKQHDEPLWKGDCVELFIDADGNRTGYVELQVNPNNATFDSFFASTRAQPGDEKWDANLVTAVKVRGTADKSGDADQGWDVEIAIPLAAVKGKHDTMGVQLPPQVGDRWRLNVVRVDYRSGGGSPSVASWNRISYSDFHALDRMLTVVFADPSGAIVAKPPEPTSPVPATGSAAPAPAPGSASLAPSTGSASPAPVTGSASPAPAPAPPATSNPKTP